MAIQTVLENIKIKSGKLVLAMKTTNSAYPTESVQFVQEFESSMTATAIKNAVAALVALYWQLYALLK